MRASLQTGGVPVELKYRPRRPRRPEIFVLCDVSTSVTSASTFFLSVLHALHDSFRKLRSFVFIERISEVTEVFERERDFRAASEAVSRDAGVADISGYTDYGRVWTEFLALIEDELHPRATVIVLGDARTNGRPPRDDVFAAITAKAGRTFWLNPEPRLYWNYGDSVIAAYEKHCTAFECWRTDQLEEFVKALTRPIVRAAVEPRRLQNSAPRRPSSVAGSPPSGSSMIRCQLRFARSWPSTASTLVSTRRSQISSGGTLIWRTRRSAPSIARGSISAATIARDVVGVDPQLLGRCRYQSPIASACASSSSRSTRSRSRT